MTRHTYELGLIGNCSYLALVKKDTNISWMCWPRFDSSFVFGSLLDEEKGGEFTIKPSEGAFESKQKYIENTNILSTEITTAEGSYRITDFAPRFRHYDRYHKPLMLVRKVEPISGAPRLRVVCKPRRFRDKRTFAGLSPLWTACALRARSMSAN